MMQLALDAGAYDTMPVHVFHNHGDRERDARMQFAAELNKMIKDRGFR
jgi:hypothetical protein